jgi:hypothetical protein
MNVSGIPIEDLVDDSDRQIGTDSTDIMAEHEAGEPEPAHSVNEEFLGNKPQKRSVDPATKDDGKTPEKRMKIDPSANE